MSKDTALNPEFAALLSAACDEAATEEQLKAIASILESDENTRKDYVEYLLIHAELHQAGRVRRSIESSLDSVLSETKPKEQRVAPAPRRKSLLDRASRHPLGPAISVAIAVMVSFLVVLAVTPMGDWIAGNGNEKPEEREIDAKKDFVAKLNHWRDAKWLEGTRPPLNDPRLNVGKRLVIASGFIEVKYLTGATVVIEGPAEFVVGRLKDEGGRRKKEGGESEGHPSSFILHPSNAGYLALGNLVARVEGKEAQGFTINTPSARVEDFGTEFGVEVRRNGATEVVVISGEVDIANEPSDAPPQRIRLTKDQGAFVATRGGAIKWSKKASADFTLAMKSRLAVMRVTLDVAPRNADRLVAYWPLKDGPAGGKVLGADDVVDDPTHPATDAKPAGEGATWVMDPERGIVLSTTKDDHLEAGTQGISRDFTWSLWIKTKEVSHNVVIGNRSGGTGGVRPPSSADFHKLTTIGLGGLATISNADGNLGVADGKWHHVAVRRSNAAANVFIDGTSVGPTAVAEGRFNGPMRIGGDDRFGERVTALLSDVAIWDKALSIERIKALAAGEPVVLGDEDPEGKAEREPAETNESKETESEEKR